uniref:Uncharacterized protein n=1 Tax=Hyaloperonospora arabidopsidis (strain Emoy2) TaxID=559515 RepID=M4BAL7_HYAAE
MSWQQSAVRLSNFGPSESACDPSHHNNEDSSILRYIKKLTTHQTNAKQQRIDRYLQHVKHAQPDEDFSVAALKPARFVSATGPTCDQLANGASASLRTKRLREENSSSNQAEVAEFLKLSNPRSQSKRPHKCNDQGIQEQVKPKRAQVKEQTTISGALDRFRFHDAALSEKTVPTHGAEECARDVTTPLVTASNGKQQRQPTQLQRSMLMPQYMDSGFNSRADSTRYPIQLQEPHLVKAYPAKDPFPDLSRSLLQSTCNTAQEEITKDDVGDDICHPEVFVRTYDPLNRIMESVFF